jgi:hypothetical protein
MLTADRVKGLHMHGLEGMQAPTLCLCPEGFRNEKFLVTHCVHWHHGLLREAAASEAPFHPPMLRCLSGQGWAGAGGVSAR